MASAGPVPGPSEGYAREPPGREGERVSSAASTQPLHGAPPSTPEQETPFLGFGSAIKGAEETPNMVGTVPAAAGAAFPLGLGRPAAA